MPASRHPQIHEASIRRNFDAAFILLINNRINNRN